MPRNRLLSGLLLLTLAVPVMAETEELFEVTVAEPGTAEHYDESFATDRAAVNRLWSKLKINALEQQTQALRMDFQRFKTVRFERQVSLANHTGSTAVQYQPQPEHIPAFMATPIRW